MKKKYETPTIEGCEFAIAARLEGSGDIGQGAHSNSPQSPCLKVASNGINSCSIPSLASSAGGNLSC